MNKTLLLVLLSVSFVSCQNNYNKPEDLKTDKEKVSYSIGVDVGNSLKANEIDVEAKAFIKGLEDALKGDSLLLTATQMQEVIQKFQQEMAAKQSEKQKIVGEKSKAEGEAFLAENKMKTGVVTTATGLQYKVVTAGKGPSPKETDKVRVHYRGRLIDGTVFDNSYDRGEPITFPLNGVIPGWTEALQLMKVGDKWEIYLPSQLGYGEAGAGTIPPNAALIFEVELLEINPKE